MIENPSETPTSLATAGRPVSTDALVETLTAACSGMPEAEGDELARGVFTQTALDGDTDAFDALLPFPLSWTDREPLLHWSLTPPPLQTVPSRWPGLGLRREAPEKSLTLLRERHPKPVSRALAVASLHVLHVPRTPR